MLAHFSFACTVCCLSWKLKHTFTSCITVQYSTCLLQVLGLATVSATAVGCQMFLDTNNVANSRGLSATGVLLMILNVAFLAVSGILIVGRGRRHIAAFAQQTKGLTQTVFQCLRRLLKQQSRQPQVVVNPHIATQDGDSVLSTPDFKQAMMP